MKKIDLSVLILSWNTKDLTLACLRALEQDKTRYSREIIVVDNGSHDGSADAIAEAFKNVTLIRNPDNRFYAEGNNQAARAATGEYLCLLNSDTEVKPGALDQLVDFLKQHPDYGGAAPKLLNMDGSVQKNCNRIIGWIDPLLDSTSFGRVPPGTWLARRTRMKDFDHQHSCDIEQPPASVFVMSRSDYESLGGLDTELALYFNDVDLCRRLLMRGRKIRFVAEAEVFHHEGASTGRYEEKKRSIDWFRQRAHYYRKHHGTLGAQWLKVVMRLYEAEQLARIKLGPRVGDEERAAMCEVRAEVRNVLSG